MDWQGALRARLIAAGPVTAIAAQRIYWVDRPQASALPAITLQTITGERLQHMTGFDGMDLAQVQVDTWAASYGEATALMEAVITALVPAQTGNGVHFERAFLDSEPRDFGERVETQFIHRKQLDLIIHHTTA